MPVVWIVAGLLANSTVLEVVAEVPPGGGYGWPAAAGTAGTTRDLWLGRHRIAAAGSDTHCVGVTFEVMWRALERLGGPRRTLTEAQARRLRRLWFVPEAGGKGAAEALPALRLGVRVRHLEDALPGDFVQLWLNDGMGHSVVLLGWDRDGAGKIVGIRYWSSQPWTDGVGESRFDIGDAPGAVNPLRIYVGRLRP